jgi:16S rRNA (guanine966-N2)-methyltransferase
MCTRRRALRVAELRIVAGEWRGRRIAVPTVGVRPTADRVREAWMSIVHPALDGARVLDLCAGTGALGLEALSRGATHCDFVERDARVRRLLGENIDALGAANRSSVHGGDALAFLGAEETGAADATAGVTPSGAGASSGESAARWDVAFADPPYAQGIAERLVRRWLETGFATIFGIEHEASVTLPTPEHAAEYAAGRTVARRVYGDTAVTFYRSAT